VRQIETIKTRRPYAGGATTRGRARLVEESMSITVTIIYVEEILERLPTWASLGLVVTSGVRGIFHKIEVTPQNRELGRVRDKRTMQICDHLLLSNHFVLRWCYQTNIDKFDREVRPREGDMQNETVTR
jgi:hypothetical protein